MTGIVSFAGRVVRPKRQPLPQRVGGFGGVAGLAAYLQAEAITHVIDATHPFAAQMSHNAVTACAQASVPLVALTRPPWTAQSGDNWHNVPDIPAAVAALSGPARRVLLAIGRMHLADFAPKPQNHYVLRLVDPPQTPPPFPDHDIIVDRGPFRLEDDLAMMQARAIDLVVSKNAGGTAAYAKIAAAREMGLPVIMIDRPVIPARAEMGCIPDVLDWIAHTGTERGV